MGFRNSKTTCFGEEESILTPQRDGLNDTKTSCFAVVMASDAFAKGVTLINN